MNVAVPPDAHSSAASASPGSGRRPVMATMAPSRTAARATAAPTPWLPPLTSTTLPSSRVTWSATVASEGRVGNLGNLVPQPVLGRRGRRGEHLGVQVRLVDRGVAPLSAAQGGEELPRLDDLQVVVAHAVGR